MRQHLCNIFLTMKYLALLCSIVITATAYSQNLVDAKFGKGIKFQPADSSFSIKFSARFQSLYVGNLNLDTDQYQDNFLIRRSRLKFDGYAHTPKLKYKLELAVSNRDNGRVTPESNLAANIVLDAVIKYNFLNNWEVWFGQTKLPGNRERVISSQKLQFVDRSQVNARFNIDRGMGVQLHNNHRIGSALIRQQFAVSFGEGRNRTAPNIGGYEYTARLEVLPFGAFTNKGDYFGSDLEREPSPKLSIGATYDQNNNTTRVSGFRGDFLSESKDQKVVFVDGMFKYDGFSSMFEYARKWTDGSPVVSDGAYYTGNGLSIQCGYLFQNNFEFAGRYTSINPEDLTNRSDFIEYTLGVSKYFVGHSLKIQSDLTYRDNDLSSNALIYRFQVELAL